MEAVIFFSLGYFFSSLLSRPRRPDRVLKWDDSVFAWRPVLYGMPLNENETVLFAYEVKKSDMKVQDEER